VALLPTLTYAVAQCGGCLASGARAKRAAQRAAELAETPLPDPPTLRDVAEREFAAQQASGQAEFHTASAQAALCGGCCLALYALLLGFYLAPPEVNVWFRNRACTKEPVA
jgi:hypothetical protein